MHKLQKKEGFKILSIFVAGGRNKFIS